MSRIPQTMSLTPEVERLFNELVDLAASERDLYFQQHSISPAHRAQVEQLLNCDKPEQATLSLLVDRHRQSAVSPAPSFNTQGASCGPYRLLRLLGAGGMGEVWLAERSDGLLNRHVALKLPNIGALAPHFAERMHREREILAKLEHPAIARLYDAGLLPNGRPFLALEYVDGQHLTAYCTAHRLSIPERLRLFLQILSAVEHAHSRLIIHRDLKPANILVTPDGQIKLLDFGIAKLLSEGEALETELTRVGGRALTPGYASPEQIAGEPVTTASDVYSLGMVLASLLCGEMLHQPRRATQSALEEAVLNHVPRRLSQTVGNPKRAEERSTTVPRLRKTLAGDLDSITAKAISRQPERRYPTVEAFRADIERYERNEPVSAQPENRLYRLNKWLRRHSLAAVAALSVLAALTIGLALALWQASVARREARTAKAVQQFTESIFRANSRNNPDPVKAQQTTARQLLDLGANAIGTSLQNAPEAKLKMLETLGSLYQDLGLDDRSVELERQRLTLAEKQFGPHDIRIVPVLIDLASSLHASRSERQREAILLRAKTILDSHHDYSSAMRGLVLNQMTENYTGKDAAKAVDLGRQAVAILRKASPSADLASALYTSGIAFQGAHLYREAADSGEEAIRLSKRFNGDPNPDLPRYYAYAAEYQATMLNYPAAESDYRHAYAYARRLGGDDDPDTLETESRLGTFLMLSSRAHEGLPLLSKALADCLRVHGPDDPFYTPQMQLQYGNLLYDLGHLEQALQHVDAALANRQKNRPWTLYTAQMLQDRAGIYLDLGRREEAEADLARADQIRQKVNVGSDEPYVNAKVRLAMEKGEWDRAGNLLRSFPSRTSSPQEPSLTELRVLSLGSELSLRTHDPAAAIAQARELRQRLTARHLESYLALWATRSEYQEGSALLLSGHNDEAIPHLERAVQRYSELVDRQSPLFGAAEARLGQAYLASGNRQKAKVLLHLATADLHQHRTLSERYLEPLNKLANDLALASARR